MSFSITFIGCSTHLSAPRFCNWSPVRFHNSWKAYLCCVICATIIAIVDFMRVCWKFSF